MSDDVVNWRLLGQRLDRIQQDMGLMRLRDEQREAGYQAVATTLSRQMVEVTAALERRLNSIDDRLDGMEDQLIAMSLKLDALAQK
jgi:hypothetical protein